LFDTFALSVLNYKELNSDFKTTSDVIGWNSVDFDSDGDNVIVTGTFKDSSEDYMSVMHIDETLTTINWLKRFTMKASSTKTLRSDEIVSHYYEKADSVIVIVHTSDISVSPYTNMINIYSLKASDGSLNWEIQFSDYSSETFGNIKSTINPFYNELNILFTNSAFDYYHIQAIDADTGAFNNNAQFEITYHYQLSRITSFPSSSALIQTSDI